MKTQAIEPPTYDGKDEIEVYYHWREALLHWMQHNCVSNRNKVVRAKNFLSGKALTFYMTEIEYKAKRLSLSKFLKELFQHCFPADWTLRERTNNPLSCPP